MRGPATAPAATRRARSRAAGTRSRCRSARKASQLARSIMATMSRPPIRIRFRRSGGFAGVSLTAATTADQLAQDHAAQVQRLLTETQAPQSPRQAAPAAGGAHIFQYELQPLEGI